MTLLPPIAAPRHIRRQIPHGIRVNSQQGRVSFLPSFYLCWSHFLRLRRRLWHMWEWVISGIKRTAPEAGDELEDCDAVVHIFGDDEETLWIFTGQRSAKIGRSGIEVCCCEGYGVCEPCSSDRYQLRTVDIRSPVAWDKSGWPWGPAWHVPCGLICDLQCDRGWIQCRRKKKNPAWYKEQH